MGFDGVVEPHHRGPAATLEQPAAGLEPGGTGDGHRRGGVPLVHPAAVHVGVDVAADDRHRLHAGAAELLVHCAAAYASIKRRLVTGACAAELVKPPELDPK